METYKKYLNLVNEGVSKDFQHAQKMFNSIVSDFKNCKSVDATSLNLVLDMLHYIEKFIEEHVQLKGISELKDAKEAVKKAKNHLDSAYDKLVKDGKAPAKKKEITPKADDFDMDSDLDAKPEGDDLDLGGEGDDLGTETKAPSGGDDLDLDSDMPKDGEEDELDLGLGKKGKM